MKRENFDFVIEDQEVLISSSGKIVKSYSGLSKNRLITLGPTAKNLVLYYLMTVIVLELQQLSHSYFLYGPRKNQICH
jgi:hypothetical protein